MFFLTCQTSLTHYFVPQHVLNTSFLVYKTPTTWHNAPSIYHFSPVRHLQHAIPTVARCDHTVSRLRKRPKDALSSKKRFSTWHSSWQHVWIRRLFPAKCPQHVFFSCKTSSECTFLAQRDLSMLFHVCEMLHNMKILEYVSQHVVSFAKAPLTCSL